MLGIAWAKIILISNAREILFTLVIGIIIIGDSVRWSQYNYKYIN